MRVFAASLSLSNRCTKTRYHLPRSFDLDCAIYNWAKGAVTEHLKTARGKIHIKFDGWTFRNQLSLLGVNCFFVDQQWRHRKLLLALLAVSGRHTGDNLVDEVADVLEEWDLRSDRLGNMVLDNASNNDTAMVALGDGFEFNPDERRLRCLSRVINLAIKQLIFGKAADAMEHTGSSTPDSKYNFDSLPADKLSNGGGGAQLVDFTFSTPLS